MILSDKVFEAVDGITNFKEIQKKTKIRLSKLCFLNKHFPVNVVHTKKGTCYNPICIYSLVRAIRAEQILFASKGRKVKYYILFYLYLYFGVHRYSTEKSGRCKYTKP